MKIIKNAQNKNRIRENKFLPRVIGYKGVSKPIYIYDIPNPNYIYYEKHHILPKSLFHNWKKREFNLVLLTPREHFFCHQLLTKIYPRKEMFFAIKQMMISKNEKRNYRFTSKEYQEVKEWLAKNINRKGLNNPMYGKKLSEKTKKKISFSVKKVMSTMSAELSRKQKEFQANHPNWNSENMKRAYRNNPEYRIKNSEVHKGMKTWTNGIITKMSHKCPEGFYKAGNNNKQVSQTLWYNNGIINKRILKGNSIPENFIPGKLKKNQKWYTDGIHSKMFLPNEQIPEGWNPGKTYTEPEGLVRIPWNKGKKIK
jgi:hypothetical protein